MNRENEYATLRVNFEISQGDAELLARIVNDTDDEELCEFCSSLLKKTAIAAKRTRDAAVGILEKNPFSFWERSEQKKL